VKLPSPAVEQLAWQISTVLKITAVREHRFHPARKWLFDLALVTELVAVEIDGGGFVYGRHARGSGMREDLVKCGEALMLGWIVVRCMPEHVASGEALRWVEAALKVRA